MDVSDKQTHELMKLSSFFGLSVIALVLVSCKDSVHYTPIRPFTPQDLVGNWVGATDARVHMYRLQLLSDGTGWLGYAFLTNQAEVCYIEKWKLEGTNLIIAHVPIIGKQQLARISVSTWGPDLCLIARGTDWKHDVVMQNEDAAETQRTYLRQKMNSATSEMRLPKPLKK